MEGRVRPQLEFRAPTGTTSYPHRPVFDSSVPSFAGFPAAAGRGTAHLARERLAGVGLLCWDAEL